jgi:hypothetical protein
MKNDDENKFDKSEDCVVHNHPVPAEKLSQYSIERDPYSEADIASYIQGQAPDEDVQHVERIKREIVLGDIYEIWDVTTDVNRWWVITNLTNLYSQKHFPSLDYTLSFHIGLMMRLKSRSDGVNAEAPSPFDEVFRRVDQAESKHENAIEAEDYQAVGMLLREALISLVVALKRRTEISENIEKPQGSNFIGWSEVLTNHLCPGSSDKNLRQHLKNTSKDCWQLVGWLTHTKAANKTASSIAIHACQTVIGHYMQILERSHTDSTLECPICKSRNIRTHFDISIGEDGDYFASCGVCDWTNKPDSTAK